MVKKNAIASRSNMKERQVTFGLMGMTRGSAILSHQQITKNALAYLRIWPVMKKTQRKSMTANATSTTVRRT